MHTHTNDLASLSLVALSVILLSCRSQNLAGSTGVVLAGVPSQEERIYRCIDPAMESMAWRLLTGELVRVQAANRFTLKVNGGRQVRVTIANVGTPEPSQVSPASDATRTLLHGKKIEVVANWSSEIDLPKHVIGVVEAQGYDVAEQLLAAGVVPFVEAQPYQLSQFSECVHRNAEAHAKRLHRGIWSGPEHGPAR